MRNQFITSLGTAETTSPSNRQKLLEDFYDYRATAIAEGAQATSIRSYIVPTQADQAGANKLVRSARTTGCRSRPRDRGVQRLRCVLRGREATSSTRAQPAKRLIRTLMDRDVPMDDAFIAEQESRRDAKPVRPDLRRHRMVDATDDERRGQRLRPRGQRAHRSRPQARRSCSRARSRGGEVTQSAISCPGVTARRPFVSCHMHCDRGSRSSSNDLAFTQPRQQRYPCGHADRRSPRPTTRPNCRSIVTDAGAPAPAPMSSRSTTAG